MLKKRLLLIGVLAVVCIAAQAFLRPALGSAEQAASAAEEPHQKALTPQAPPENFGSGAGQLQSSLFGRLVWTMLVTGLMVVAVWWICKRMSCRWNISGGKFIRRLETLSLGPRNSVHLVQVGNKKFLLAAGADQVRMLADVSEAVIDQNPEQKSQ